MAYLAEYGLFFAKVLTLFLMIVGVLVSLVGIAMRNRHAPSEQIEVKRINDRFGHPAGDAVIKDVGKRAKQALRKRDLVGRIGGEEFGVILPNANLAAATAICERLRQAIAGNPVVREDAIIAFTASIGIAEFQAGDEADHLLTRADVALYDAKTGGRNQVRTGI